MTSQTAADFAAAWPPPGIAVNGLVDWLNVYQRERWGEHASPLAKLAVITEELGELAEAVLAVHDVEHEVGARLDRYYEALDHAGDELADVLIATLGLAGLLGLDVEDCFLRKLNEVINR